MTICLKTCPTHKTFERISPCLEILVTSLSLFTQFGGQNIAKCWKLREPLSAGTSLIHSSHLQPPGLLSESRNFRALPLHKSLRFFIHKMGIVILFRHRFLQGLEEIFIKTLAQCQSHSKFSINGIFVITTLG